MPVTAVVGVALAGGRSRRLGFDKAGLRLVRAGVEQTLLEWTVRRLAAVCAEVVVAAGDQLRERVALRDGDTAASSAPILVPDAPPPAAGPAAGLLGAAAARPGSALLALACDLPRVPVALLERLWREHRQQPEAAWVVPVRSGRPEPLCALYAPAALAALAQRVAGGSHALHELRWVAGLSRCELLLDGVDELGGAAEPFLNLNTREDLERFRALERSPP